MNQFVEWVKSYGVRFDIIAGTLLILALAAVIISYANRIIYRLLLRYRSRFHFSYETILLITRIVTVALWIGLSLLLLGFWGVSVTGLWSVLVSVAAIIGVGFLAVWTMVSNITANLFITIWRPFHLGATVELLPENLRGRVIDRNMMFTILREKEGGILFIPNNLFFQKIFRVTESNQQHMFEFFENQNLKLPEMRSTDI